MLDVIAPLVISNTTKIVLISLDGLGGLPRPETGRSELETAHLPNLSQLATEAACGLIRHVAPGITPGSGPGHLGLFGTIRSCTRWAAECSRRSASSSTFEP